MVVPCRVRLWRRVSTRQARAQRAPPAPHPPAECEKCGSSARRPLEIALAFLDFHGAFLVVIDDAVFAFAAAELDHLFDDFGQGVGGGADGALVAANISQQLARRIAFKKAMKQAVQRTMKAGAKGVKIAV